MRVELDYRKIVRVFIPAGHSLNAKEITNWPGEIVCYYGSTKPEFVMGPTVYDFDYLTNQVVWC